MFNTIIDGPGEYLTVEGELVVITGPHITKHHSPWGWEGAMYTSRAGYVRNMWRSNGAFFFRLGDSEYDIVRKVQ